MDFIVSLLISFLTTLACLYFLTPKLGYQKRAKLPPGPYSFPVIGNILHLGKKPHQSLARLAKDYGPIMYLKLGSRTTIVVSSPTIAREVLQKNDQVLSSRTIPSSAHAYDHYKFSMLWLPASGQWRCLRKICKELLFSTQRLDASQALRQEKLQRFSDYLLRCSSHKQAVNIGEAAFTTSLNLLSTTFFSIDFATYDSNSSQEFKEIVWGIMETIATPNLADYFPILRFMDLQGISRKSKFLHSRLFDIFDKIVEARGQLLRHSSGIFLKKNDFLEALLDHDNESEAKLSHNDLKHLFLDLFAAGTDTTSSAVEWAMAELLRNPEKMAKARAEFQEVVEQKKKVQESDIPRLPYLQAVVKETLRLHPVAPFLGPHKADADVEINGYIVPKNANVLVNVWAYGRDSSIWSNPEVFAPERFLQSKVDMRGQQFELIPFGAGRRICPGLPLAYPMLHLMLASLIRDFEWKLEGGGQPKDIDMEDKFGLTIQKAIPLKAIPVSLV